MPPQTRGHVQGRIGYQTQGRGRRPGVARGRPREGGVGGTAGAVAADREEREGAENEHELAEETTHGRSFYRRRGESVFLDGRSSGRPFPSASAPRAGSPPK